MEADASEMREPLWKRTLGEALSTLGRSSEELSVGRRIFADPVWGRASAPVRHLPMALPEVLRRFVVLIILWCRHARIAFCLAQTAPSRGMVTGLLVAFGVDTEGFCQ